MSACLNDARIQAVADREATTDELAHVDGCATCRARVSETRAAEHAFARGMEDVSVPPLLGARVNAAVARAAGRSGATTLRTERPQRPRWLMAGVAAAAAVLVLVFVLFPSFDPATRLSASEILDRSLQTLSVHGTERLRYELTVDAPIATAESGTFVIEQLIDHQTGRWRFARFAPDGTLLNGIAENPGAHLREAVLTADGQAYRFHFEIAPEERVALWDVQRRCAEAMIRLVQSSTTHVVSTEQGPDGERYVVDLPAAERPAAAAPLDLTGARVVVDASDFHIVEFTASGIVMGEAVSIGYKLAQRDLLGGVLADAEFGFPARSGEIALTGAGSREVPRDFMSLLLKEIAQHRP